MWDDLDAVLALAPHEAQGVLDALNAGHVDGSVYEGACACLVGTIANLRGESYEQLTCGIVPDAGRPAEQWFLAIRRGATPENSPVARVTAEHIAAWIAAHPAEIAPDSEANHE